MQKSKDFRSQSRTAQKLIHNYELISELLNTDDGIKLDLDSLLQEKSLSLQRINGIYQQAQKNPSGSVKVNKKCTTHDNMHADSQMLIQLF